MAGLEQGLKQELQVALKTNNLEEVKRILAIRDENGMPTVDINSGFGSVETALSFYLSDTVPIGKLVNPDIIQAILDIKDNEGKVVININKVGINGMTCLDFVLSYFRRFSSESARTNVLRRVLNTRNSDGSIIADPSVARGNVHVLKCAFDRGNAECITLLMSAKKLDGSLVFDLMGRYGSRSWAGGQKTLTQIAADILENPVGKTLFNQNRPLSEEELQFFRYGIHSLIKDLTFGPCRNLALVNPCLRALFTRRKPGFNKSDGITTFGPRDSISIITIACHAYLSDNKSVSALRLVSRALSGAFTVPMTASNMRNSRVSPLTSLQRFHPCCQAGFNPGSTESIIAEACDMFL